MLDRDNSLQAPLNQVFSIPLKFQQSEPCLLLITQTSFWELI